MFFSYDLRDLPQDLPLRGLFVPIWFLQKISKKGVKSEFQIFLGFNNKTIFCSQSGQTIALTVVDGRFVKEASILFSFLEPFHSSFLVLLYFLLVFSLTEFLKQKAFLLPDIRCET